MEIVVRVFLIYVFVLICMRVIGKREMAQLSPFELVMLMLIPDIAQQGMVRENHSITNALIGLGTLFSLTLLSGFLTYRFKAIQFAHEGEPTVIFREGRFFQDKMDKERVSSDEVIAEMHKAGIESLSQVKWIILETDGQLSYIPYRASEHGPPRERKLNAI